MYADDTITTNENLADESIVAVVTGAEDDSSDDNEPEPVQVVLHQEALRMVDSLRDYAFVKKLSLGYAQQLDRLQKNVHMDAVVQKICTCYFVCQSINIW